MILPPKNTCSDQYIFFLYSPERIFEESETKEEEGSVSQFYKNTSEEKKIFITKKTV